MYPIAVGEMMRRSTRGANALDPTRPHRPPRHLLPFLVGLRRLHERPELARSRRDEYLDERHVRAGECRELDPALLHAGRRHLGSVRPDLVVEVIASELAVVERPAERVGPVR